MFNIGDKVVYPSQGIGIIDVIEEKELNGEKIKCYIIHLINNTMKLTLPIRTANTSNMRLISDIKTLENSLKHVDRFTEEAEKFSKINYKERRSVSKIKIKSGTFDEFLEVIFDLTQLKKWHSLNSSEKQMLNYIKKIVIEEIAQAKGLTSNEASELLDLSINLNKLS
ncbi:CarD family transcriptional regulator [Clostridium beijerinckii]|uniref:CarD family transcriptional regulator n=1 Tax=Clostridium beijerinckii TaxID=1520 RepID=UPI001494E0AF|nr:CarD family transcriptional regulator [Clostridium beijerinckii]NOW03448.1 RNA polymerase-interacting CarD/CdnL/TRCF family regulator [Clostridium beijerinckii]NRT71001.1 RNA polymerase-interacting CarD/CdnL/TRCF family regulator [Clostridium beijerinckii]NYC03410.1 RNA polymerase-interacting CarD/CdnL/TRCF family regulator [Clostridium beijerinckii]UYZ37042.1 CarD family transcriptional regulator [Clostridium beijerinckii]